MIFTCMVDGLAQLTTQVKPKVSTCMVSELALSTAHMSMVYHLMTTKSTRAYI